MVLTGRGHSSDGDIGESEGALIRVCAAKSSGRTILASSHLQRYTAKALSGVRSFSLSASSIASSNCLCSIVHHRVKGSASGWFMLGKIISHPNQQDHRIVDQHD